MEAEAGMEADGSTEIEASMTAEETETYAAIREIQAEGPLKNLLASLQAQDSMSSRPWHPN